MFYKNSCLPERHSPCKQKPSSSINLNAICWKFHLGMWPQSRWGKWEESTSGNRTFFEARWWKQVKNQELGRIPRTNECHHFQEHQVHFDKQGKTQFNADLFSSIHCNTDSPVNIYPSCTSAFQSLEAGRTQNQDPCHGQYGRLLANSLSVHLTVDR